MKYTREQLETMPDRELDAVVAEVVFGYPTLRRWEAGEFYSAAQKMADAARVDRVFVLRDGEAIGGHYWFPRGSAGVRANSDYSTDIAAAWKVVERITPRAAQVDVWARRGGKYACYVHSVDEDFWKEGDFVDDVFAEADTAPRAISIAAVLAVQEATR